jgi:hypothetical protein
VLVSLPSIAEMGGQRPADVNGDHNADFSLNVYTAPGFGTFHGWDFIL